MKPAIVVSGAARGIGRATALQLARSPFRLLLTDLNADGLRETASAISSGDGECAVFPADIADAAAPASILSAALDRFGAVDGLVHVAGVGVRAAQDILDVTGDDYDRCADINARAAFFMMQRFARHFVETDAGGRFRFIAVVTSSNASAISIDRSEYCVSKAAAAMATQLFATRLAPHGVTVAEIRPGVIETDLTAPRIEAYRARIGSERLTAIPRLGTVDDVARTIETVALGRLPYTVGQVLSVDGGVASRRY